MNRSQDAIFRPALILMSGRFVGFVAAFGIPMVLARLFTLEEFGAYKQLFLVYGTLFGIAQVGMAESLYYFLPADAVNARRYIRNTLSMLGAVGLGCLLLLWLEREAVAALLGNPGLAPYLPQVGLFLLLMLLSVVLEIVLTARKQHLGASCAYAASDFARALFLVVPVLLIGGLEWLMLGAIAFALLRLLATLVALRGSGLPAAAAAPDSGLLRRHLTYALPFGLAGLIEIVQLNFHLFAVSRYFDPATFAIYAVGCLQVPVVDFLMTSTCNVMMVSMQERLREGRRRAALLIWQDAMRKLALVLCPLVALLVVLSHELIVFLFTPTYAAAQPVFVVWTLAMALTTLLTDGVLRVFAQTRFLIVQNLLRLAVIALGIGWFLDTWGLIGAVLITAVATLVARVLALWRIKVVFRVRLRHLLPWGSLALTVVLAALATVPVLGLQALLDLPVIVTLALGGLAYALSYGGLLLWLGPLHEDEKYALRAALERPFRRRALKAEPAGRA